MATVRLKNVNPLGYVDLPLIRRALKPGEEFDVDAAHAGRAPTPAKGEPGDDDYAPADPGDGLLAQIGNYELVTKPKTKPKDGE